VAGSILETGRMIAAAAAAAEELLVDIVVEDCAAAELLATGRTVAAFVERLLATVHIVAASAVEVQLL
jgi:ABC-type transport system involved in cytochrome bd biosynthesis fused ATPase/permease subunit